MTAPAGDPPALQLGGAPLGNLLGAIDDDGAAATVEAAWGAGIRWFDTAPLYGLGTSERRLGAALAGRPREQYVLTTKVGCIPVPHEGGPKPASLFVEPDDLVASWDFSAAAVRRSLEESLERLGVGRVDIAYVHDPDDHLDWVLEETLPELHALREEGLIGAVGAGMNYAAPLARLVREGGLDALMLARRYTLLDHSALDELLPLCLERGVAVAMAGVYNSGILAMDRPGPGALFHYERAPDEVIARGRAIAAVCARHAVPLGAAALAFSRRHLAASAVTVGARTPEEVRRTAAWWSHPVPEELWTELRDAGLIRPDAP